MIQSPCTSAAQIPWGERCWQQGRGLGGGSCTYSLQSRGCVPRHRQGQRVWDSLEGEPGGGGGARGPIPASSFTSSRDSKRSRCHGSWLQQGLANLAHACQSRSSSLLQPRPVSSPCTLDCALKITPPRLCLCPSAQNSWSPSSIKSRSLLSSTSIATHFHSYAPGVPVTHHLGGTRPDQWNVFVSVCPISWDVFRLQIPRPQPGAWYSAGAQQCSLDGWMAIAGIYMTQSSTS